jgi:hypothetical protein
MFNFNYDQVEVLELLEFYFLFLNIPVASFKMQCVSLAKKIYYPTQRKLLLMLLFRTNTTAIAVLEVRKM